MVFGWGGIEWRLGGVALNEFGGVALNGVWVGWHWMNFGGVALNATR
jgi:hypothetical protein